MPKTIVLLASGTRGDVQPYLALGLGLQVAGYRAVVATHPGFRSAVEGWGLDFAALDGNPSELMTQAGGQPALTYDGNWLRSARSTLSYVRHARPLYSRMLESAWQACQGADALVVGLATTWGVHIAQALCVPCLWAFLQPFGRTHLHPSALLPGRLSLGGTYNWLTYLLVEQAMWQPWRAVTNRWRKTLQLGSSPLTGPLPGEYRQGATFLYGYSPLVASPPPDWPVHHYVTGYWFTPDLSAWSPPVELERFIESGAPPVYIGFGSPGTPRPREILQVVLRALLETGLRAVLSFPGQFLAGLSLPASIYPLQEVSHSWLFPRMAAIVHHGGAGTTGAGLRAGLPAVISPLAVDQFFWGERLSALGVGPPAIPQRALSVQKLVQALQQAVLDPGYSQRAGQLAQAIRKEDGVLSAVEIIRQQVH